MIATALVAAAGGAEQPAMAAQDPIRSTDLPRARPGNVAVQEELDAARKAGTVEAYDQFLARHPGHALAETARRERAALAVSREK